MQSASIETVETPYGPMVADQVRRLQASYDLQALLRCIAEYDQVMEYLSDQDGPRDALARLYCVSATVLAGASAVVAPHEMDFCAQVGDLRSDFEEAIKFLQAALDLVEPLEQLAA